MSKQPNKQCLPQRHVRVWRVGVCLALLIGLGLLPPAVGGETIAADRNRPLPLLVKTRAGDTPATLARQYLNDPSKGWMIVEYNGLTTFSDGQAVLIPSAPFQLGGLTPEGYQTVPVLVYRSIAESAGQQGQVSRSAFEEQMGWLKNGGFTTITPAQLIDFMDFSGQVPQRSVLITADTESLAFHDLAMPILKSFGFTATLFVATDRVGHAPSMTWDQLKRVRQDGFTIGCRGRREQSLTGHKNGPALEAYFRAIEADLQQAKKAFEHHLDAPCTILAYPQGYGSDLVAAMAAKLGFSAAFVSSAGENPFFVGRFGIHRRIVDRRMNPEQFNELLTTRVSADLNR